MYFCRVLIYSNKILLMMKNEKQRQILPRLHFPIIADQEPKKLSFCRPTAIIRNGVLWYYVLGRDGDTDAAIIFTNDTPHNLPTTAANQLWQLQRWPFAELEKLTEWPYRFKVYSEPEARNPLRTTYGTMRIFAHYNATIEECNKMIINKL